MLYLAIISGIIEVEMEYTEWDVAYIRGIRYKDLGLMLKT
jgi:hypothetical protein